MPTFSGRSTSPSSSQSSLIPTRPNSPLSNLTRHASYYLPGADLFIQISTTLFAIHRYFLIRESSFWLGLLQQTIRGTTARNPIILTDEISISPVPTVDTFSEFLWVFYNPYYSYQNTPVETWWTIEVYATHFGMRNILELIDRELHTVV